MSSLDQIASAVLDWQRRHPLALRLGPDAVHSIGLVALPFVRPAEGSDAPPPPPWWQRWRGVAGPDRAAFSETFIEGIAPAAAARFALQRGVESVEGLDDWPQRRVEVDSALAETVSGGWPYERWLASAALEGPHGRQRVLISLRENGPPAVLGHRHWDRSRLVIAALLPTLALAAWLMLRPSPPPPANPPSAAGSVASAASAASAAPAINPAISPASGASGPVLPEAASAALEPASSAMPPDAAASAAVPDIRPRLGPQRAEIRPPMGAGSAAATTKASAATGSGASSSPSVTASAAPAAPQPATDAPSLRALPPGAPPVALISPGFAKQADAEAMLARMLEHTGKTLAKGARLDGEVFSSPQGFRAAVWPFASREEAQLINATMVARGWKTRAVDF